MLIFFKRCRPGEPGEFTAKIVQGHPVRGFPGYFDETATKKKIIHNVFTKGDRCFKSGDILVADRYGWLYFVDRLGDTFRWKGENVSTAEVEATITSMDGTMIKVNFHIFIYIYIYRYIYIHISICMH